jgi:integrase
MERIDPVGAQTPPRGTVLPPVENGHTDRRPAGQGALVSGLAPGDPLYETARAAQNFAKAARSPATRRAYNSDWKDFAAWCAENALESLPAAPSTVALYLSAQAAKGRKPATITRKLTSISTAHRRAGHPSPCDRTHLVVTETLQGIRRTLGTRQVGKEPVTVELLRKAIGAAEGTLTASRDRALLLVGFAGGMRRSELAALRIEHLRWHRKGITVFLPSSKTDQEQQGREVELPLGIQPAETHLSELTCPVRALDQWLRQASIKEGPVFRKVTHAQTVCGGLGAHSVGWIVKRALGRAGLSGRELARYGAHSLRAGFATEAYGNGASELAIMRQTGHRSSAMVRKYIRADRQDRQTAAGKLGL